MTPDGIYTKLLKWENIEVMHNSNMYSICSSFVKGIYEFKDATAKYIKTYIPITSSMSPRFNTVT